MFVAVAFGISGTFFLYNTLLLLKRWQEADTGDPLFIGGAALRGVGLVALAFQWWQYSMAVGRYNRTGEVAVLEKAHAAAWRWSAGFMAAYLLYSAVIIWARIL